MPREPLDGIPREAFSGGRKEAKMDKREPDKETISAVPLQPDEKAAAPLTKDDGSVWTPICEDSGRVIGYNVVWPNGHVDVVPICRGPYVPEPTPLRYE
jgi:hypothetical protein